MPVTRRRVAARALDLSRLGHAHWLFGNLYEAVVKVPDLLASRGGSVSGPGSPVRYYALAAPATVPALVVAVATGWRDRGSRPWLVTAAVCSISGVAMTAYLVRAVNLRLFFSAKELSEDERETLLRKWYRLNTVRLALTGAAWLAAGRARSELTGEGHSTSC